MRRFLTALAFTTALPTLALAQSAGMEMTEDERAAFRAEVRAYLLDNPEVIFEAVEILEARQAAQQAAGDAGLVAANLAELHDTTRSHASGNLEGDITLVEFIDYRCSFCRRAHEDVSALIASDGNIRLITKEFPILGEASTASSRFAIAVLQLGGGEVYEAANNALIRLRGNPDAATLDALAVELGLDPEAVRARSESAEVTAVIQANHALGQRLGINGTPTFVLESEMLRGYLPLDQMQAAVAAVRG